MKQIIQSLKNGAIEVATLPIPQCGSKNLLIKTHKTLISAGTERMLLEFGKSNWINKALQQPDKVRQVIEKTRTDGLLATIESVQNKLDQPLPLGYSNVGEIIQIGSDVQGFCVGDRVVSNGPHAEIISVPQYLCAKIPDNVNDETATFTIVGAIALQGVRLMQPTLGETFAVFGLGLIGLLTVQILLANGCQVIGFDFDPQKLKIAEQFGIQIVNLEDDVDPVAFATQFTNTRGVDGVFITASTQSNEPIHQAAQMCRKRGRIILVGVAGLELLRSDFYAKELTFQVSCSYGPGRYDNNYEHKSQDYPYGFVRWTAQRNFSAILTLMATEKINILPFLTHRFLLNNAQQAYDTLVNSRSAIGILLEYPDDVDTSTNIPTLNLNSQLTAIGEINPSEARVGFIGAGNYALRTLMPEFHKAKAKMEVVVSARGLTAQHAAKKFPFNSISTQVDLIFNNPHINTVVIVTQHQSHASLVCRGLKSGKHVFVEKPLALTLQQIDDIKTNYAGSNCLLMVGFNRRFSPLIIKMKKLLQTVREPKAFIMTVNAGFIPDDHWTQDRTIGGGRMIGEGCHFIDLLRFLCGHSITDFKMQSIPNKTCDTFSVTLCFADGSIGTLHYLSNGHKQYSKEYLHVFTGGKILILENFRNLKGYGWKKFKNMKLWRQDKGQKACVNAFLDAIRHGSDSPIPFDELIEVSNTVINIASQLNQNQ